MTSSSLKRSSSLGRLAADDDDYRYRMAIEKLRCDLVGFPYCCNKHYTAYRRPPYYADLDYPYYYRGWNDRSPYWADWPYAYNRRPWYYDDYQRDYMRGYEEGLKKYEARPLRRSTSSADLNGPMASSKLQPTSQSAAAADDVTGRLSAPPPPPVPSYYDRYPPYWYHSYYYRPPYYWRRYLDSRAY